MIKEVEDLEAQLPWQPIHHVSDDDGTVPCLELSQAHEESAPPPLFLRCATPRSSRSGAAETKLNGTDGRREDEEKQSSLAPAVVRRDQQRLYGRSPCACAVLVLLCLCLRKVIWRTFATDTWVPQRFVLVKARAVRVADMWGVSSAIASGFPSITWTGCVTILGDGADCFRLRGFKFTSIG
jgi:hypothetical protein